MFTIMCMLVTFMLTTVWAAAGDPGPSGDSAWRALQQAVQTSGTVTLTEDVICDNQEYGPIVVPEGVTVTIDLNGYKIDRNLTSQLENGAVINVSGSLTVKDGSSGETGKITGGYSAATYKTMVAGGIQVNDGSLVLESGSITGCSSQFRGAGVNVEKGNFTMNGGSISGNRATSHGAGVDVTSGIFTMTGGIISENQANVGAGVYASNSDLILSGGEISGNKANESAGGLNASGDVNVTLTGCKITDNTAPKAGGVSFYLKDGCSYSFKVDKNTVITGNTDTNGNPSNLYVNNFNNSTWITIMDGSYAPNGMNIGISSFKTPTDTTPVQISDATMQKACKNCFFSDKTEYWIDIKDDILYLTTEPPTHSVTYASNSRMNISGVGGNPATTAKVGDTVYFKVTPDTGYTLGSVSAKESSGKSVTLFLNSDIYSFTMPDDDITVAAGLAIDVPAAVIGIIYDGSEKTGVAYGEGYTLTYNTAVDAGSYTAVASLNEGYIWNGGVTEDEKIDWNIAKASPTVSSFIFTASKNLIADGNPKYASITFDTKDGKLTGMGSVTISYQKRVESGWGTSTTDAPTEPGTYKVLADVSEGDNFTSVSELTADSWMFTITAPTLTKIEITSAPAKTVYTAGESFDSTGMVVTAIYNDNSTKAVTDYTISPSGALVTTDTAVTVSYNEGSETKTTEQAITVNPVPVTLAKIEITTVPAKTVYTVGERFDSTGMVVTAIYSDSSTKTVTGYTISPSGALAATDTVVTVSYTEGSETKMAEQAVTVNPVIAILTGISISKAPDKSIYTEGETFDGTGMIVTATYSDGSSKPVIGYDISPFGALSITNTTVEIRYTENGVTKHVNLIIRVNPTGPVVYKIITGKSQTVLTEADSAMFASDADFSKFDHVEVDGRTVAKKYYTAESGSTVIIFTRDYIKTLRRGEHKLTIVSDDGSASTIFMVSAPLPPTGDNAHPALLLMLLLTSMGMLLLISVKAKKRNED